MPVRFWTGLGNAPESWSEAAAHEDTSLINRMDPRISTRRGVGGELCRAVSEYPWFANAYSRFSDELQTTRNVRKAAPGGPPTSRTASGGTARNNENREMFCANGLSKSADSLIWIMILDQTGKSPGDKGSTHLHWRD